MPDVDVRLYVTHPPESAGTPELRDRSECGPPLRPILQTLLEQRLYLNLKPLIARMRAATLRNVTA